jgi:aerobic C4-dicarboxylate transport protein
MSAEFDPVQADSAYAQRFGAGVKFNLKPLVTSADQEVVPAASMISPQPD